MKTKLKLFSVCLLMMVCIVGCTAQGGTKILLYPAARAFGSPPESELERCRVAFTQMKANLDKSHVVVMPVLFADQGRCQWRNDLADMEMREFAARTPAKLERSLVEPNVAAPDLGHNQLRYLWKRITVYSDWIKATHPKGDYVLITEIFGGEGKAGAIHIFLFDASGQVAFRRLLNSHQFGSNLSLVSEDIIKRIVNTFFNNLKLDAKKVFPPYGIG